MHLDRPFGEAAVPVFTWTNQLPFAAQSNQATRALIRLATTETTLFIYDKELFRDADYTKDVVFEGARVMTANRLAEDGKQWVDIFKLFNRYWDRIWKF